MGWTYMEKPSNIKKWFEDTLTWETDNYLTKCLKSHILLREGYAAIEQINKTTGEREVFAAIWLFHYKRSDFDDYNFGYKEMDESVGPYYYNCPASILDLLTETKNEYAIEWRNKNREVLSNKKPRPKIEIGKTYTVLNSSLEQVRIVDKIRGFWIGVYGGCRYKIRSTRLGELV